MRLDKLVQVLDKEFKRTEENLTAWAVTDDNRKAFNSDFIAGKTGLMLKSSESVDVVYTTVFITDTIIGKMAKNHGNILLFSHHGLNFHEDERGLETVKYDAFKRLKDAGVSVYVSHASLDTHHKCGTSLCLAKTLNIIPEDYFYDYYGYPIAVIGNVPGLEYDSFADFVAKRLERPFVKKVKCSNHVHKVAIAAGGGDSPDILRVAFEKGCDTFITGTVENRWAVEGFQYLNRKFHELNSKLKLNLIGGTHFGTERPAMKYLVYYFKEKFGIDAEYCEDETLLNAL